MRSLIALLLLAGCTSVPTMTADQLNAIPNGSAFCGTFTGTGGTGKLVVVKLDEVVALSGSVSVDSNTCAVTMTSNAAAVVAAKAALAAAQATAAAAAAKP